METPTDLLEQLVLRLQNRESLDVEFKHGKGGLHSSDAIRMLVGLREAGHLVSDGFGRWTTYGLSDAARHTYEAAADPPHPDLFDVELATERTPARQDLDATGQDLDATGQDLDATVPERLPSFPGTPAQWAGLAGLAQPVRGEARTSQAAFGDAVVALCTQQPLSMVELMTLLGRQSARTRRIVSALVADGRLALLYPDRPNSPHQRYTAPR